MPITKSAKEYLRQSKRKGERNLKQRKELKGLLKEVRSLIEKKDKKGAEKMLPQVYKMLDKAAKVNLIKKNTASRKKSRITKALMKA